MQLREMPLCSSATWRFGVTCVQVEWNHCIEFASLIGRFLSLSGVKNLLFSHALSKLCICRSCCHPTETIRGYCTTTNSNRRLPPVLSIVKSVAPALIEIARRAAVYDPIIVWQHHHATRQRSSARTHMLAANE